MKASAPSPATDPRMRTTRGTVLKYIDGRLSTRLTFPDPIESESDCGRRAQASLRRPLEPKPFRRVPALRPAHGAVRRPLPELRIQDLAVERNGLGCLQGVARRRPHPARRI